MLAVVHAVYT